MQTLNYWPVLVASVVSFGIGSLWYSPLLFGHIWIDLLKVSDADMSRIMDSGIWKRYIAQLIMTFVTFCVLGFALNVTAIASAADGAFLGLLAWLGFSLPVSLAGFLWKNESPKLVLIDSVYYLIALAIGGAILGAWR